MYSKQKNLRRFAAFWLVIAVLFAGVPIANVAGAGSAVALAATVTEPTIRMGDNAPMTRVEFEVWRTGFGIRFFNFEGQIYPAGIFFGWGSGGAFRYGEVKDGMVSVTLVPNADTSNPGTEGAGGSAAQNPQAADESDHPVPIVFADLTPILFSDDELTAMIENVPRQNPMDVRSAIRLPNRRLTETELAAWIDEYGEMGGVTAFELSVIREINCVRVQHRLKPLALDPALMLSARLKTQEFGDLQYFGHISPVHGNPTAAARMFGYKGSRTSENITRSGSSGAPVFSATPEGIVNGMLASKSGHREILLNPNASSVGFGAFFSPNSTGPNGRMSHMFYYAAQFGFYD